MAYQWRHVMRDELPEEPLGEGSEGLCRRRGSKPPMNSSMDAASPKGMLALATGMDRGGAITIWGRTLLVTMEPVLMTAPLPIRNVLPAAQITTAQGPT